MKTVHVAASKEYDVLIGEGLLSQLHYYVQQVANPSKIVIVSDTHVWPLYGPTAVSVLEKAGYLVHSYVFNAGEENKNGHTYLSLLDYLACNQVTRSDLLIALGGGVVGDMTGFAAATYLRGINYIQIPTTLLAAVDSSVGGKTAIDLPSGKNLAGAFYQPKLVLCDLRTLDTLPEETFRDGCAEVIKYGILYDPQLFRHLQTHTLAFDREYVISRCVELKRNVVCEDEFDRGSRQKLNLGHTIGHAVEHCSHFTVPHGKAVAIGMAIIARFAVREQLCDSHTTKEILELLQSFRLPCKSDYSSIELSDAALSDKKRSTNTVNLIIPRKIGQCDIVPCPVSKLHSVIEAGL